ncbi:MAG TPA: hypothetical protein VG983_00155 [Caulobacterales bacterium]|jgi:hypothetical protein|nr:hypothetical protein [Caulobacterales bacterium]
MWRQVRNGLIIAAAAGLVLFGMGFAVATPARMPSYALVFLDDDNEAYLAPQCVPLWRRHAPPEAHNLRRSHLAAAEALDYKPDDACARTSAFHPPGPSLSRLLLQKFGVIGPPAQWWDVPYRTEDGMVYPPNTHV